MTVARTVLREQIKDLLLARILEGRYTPGERLVELQIAQELGVSQAPVREALRDLESLRFVESQPFKGTRVRTISKEELIEIYPVRAALEEVAAQAAATRLNGHIEALQAELDAMLRAADAGDRLDQVHHDAEFHRLIVEASGNRTLIDVWRSLRIEARTLITALKTGADLHQIAELHRPVLAALAEGDPDKAGEAIRRHVEYFGELLRDEAAAPRTEAPPTSSERSAEPEAAVRRTEASPTSSGRSAEEGESA